MLIESAGTGALGVHFHRARSTQHLLQHTMHIYIISIRLICLYAWGCNILPGVAGNQALAETRTCVAQTSSSDTCSSAELVPSVLYSTHRMPYT